jgi:hypothetical protein
MVCPPESWRQLRAMGLAVLFSVSVVVPAPAFDGELSPPQAIREAYFLGTRRGGLAPEFLARYSSWVKELHEGSCTSEIRVETPFLQVANYASKVLNYTSQDAVKDFEHKPLNFRIFLNICYMREAPAPSAVRIKILQNKKKIVPLSDTRAPYAEPLNEYGTLPPNGEKVEMEFAGRQIDSSTLSIQIDRPDDQHVTTQIDLQNVR